MKQDKPTTACYPTVPLAALFGLALVHALYALLCLAAAFEHPPGNAILYWPGVVLVVSTWALWRRAWWARGWALLACATVLASPLFLGDGFDRDPLGFMLIALGAAWLLAAVPSAGALYWLTRSSKYLPLRLRPRGFHWTILPQAFMVALLIAGGVALHGAQQIERSLAEWADRHDQQHAERLVANLVDAVRAGDRQAVAQAEAALAEGKTYSWAPYRNAHILPAIIMELERRGGPDETAVRRALLRALHLRGFTHTAAPRLSFVRDRLLKLLHDPDPEIRRLALRGVVPAKEAISPLAERIRDPGEASELRVEALRKLGTLISDPHRNVELRAPVFSILIQAANSEDPVVRSTAVDTLVVYAPRATAEAVHNGALPLGSVLPALAAELERGDWFHQLQVAEALGLLGPQAESVLPQLRAALGSKVTATPPPQQQVSATRRLQSALRDAIEAIEGTRSPTSK